MIYLGDFTLGDSVYFTYDNFSLFGENITFLPAAAEIRVYRAGQSTYATGGAFAGRTGDVGGFPGFNAYSISTSTINTFTPGFIAAGNDYVVCFVGITPSATTYSLPVAHFSIENRTSSGGGGSAPTAIEIRQEIDSNSTRLATIEADTNELQSDLTEDGRIDTILDDILSTLIDADPPPTTSAIVTAIDGSSFVLRTARDAAVALELAWHEGERLESLLSSRASQFSVDDIQGATFDTATDSLEAIRNRGDAAWITGAGGGSAPTAIEIRQEMDANSTQFAATAASIAALPTATENADAFLIRNMAGGSNGGRDVRSALRANRNRVEINPLTGVITVYEEDDTTIAWTGQASFSARNPISSMDPD